MDRKEFTLKLLDLLLKNQKVVVMLWLSVFGFGGYTVFDSYGGKEQPRVEAPVETAIPEHEHKRYEEYADRAVFKLRKEFHGNP